MRPHPTAQKGQMVVDSLEYLMAMFPLLAPAIEVPRRPRPPSAAPDTVTPEIFKKSLLVTFILVFTFLSQQILG
jgi:hypothetical protein